MPYRMSCSLTIPAVQARTKTVTRRAWRTWRHLEEGQPLILVEKAQGLPKGATQVILGTVEVTSIRVEPLRNVAEAGELEREGLAHLNVEQFIVMWCRSHGYGNLDPQAVLRGWVKVACRRIEWRYLEEPTP